MFALSGTGTLYHCAPDEIRAGSEPIFTGAFCVM